MKLPYAALAACCAFNFAAHLDGQTGGPPDRSPTAGMRFDNGASITLTGGHGLLGRVAARTNQAVAVQLQFPTDLAGEIVAVQSVDGADVIGSANRLVVDSDGSATVQLRLGPPKAFIDSW